MQALIAALSRSIDRKESGGRARPSLPGFCVNTLQNTWASSSPAYLPIYRRCDSSHPSRRIYPTQSDMSSGEWRRRFGQRVEIERIAPVFEEHPLAPVAALVTWCGMPGRTMRGSLAMRAG